ncbi:MAG: uncharacterized protein KVP18_002640 [Porospora cf. gigantea A]|uniref:uncharacterized protein n=1 Tax=Porospora cf. gigantea A TaxID=2853593 RepID=UPI00355AA697|nr:MAG: hypothetical protein KVP18_002640 [Porospora cf. gigantea A]
MAAETFLQKFGISPEFVVQAPGRVNIIGEHVDHQYYPVFPCAINHHIDVGVAKTLTGSLLVIQHAESEYETFDSGADYANIRVGPKGTWWNYVVAAYLGCVEYLITGDIERAGKVIDGTKGLADACVSAEIRERLPRLRILVQGNVPIASGVSSSSALCVASALAVGSCFWGVLPFNRNQLAVLVTEAERHSGTAGGGMDQAAICLSEVGKALKIEFKPLKVHCNCMPEGTSLVVVNTCEPAAKARDAPFMYNKRVFELRVGAYLLLKRGCDTLGLDAPADLDGADTTYVLRQVQQYLGKSLVEMANLTRDLLKSTCMTKDDVEAVFPDAKRQTLLQYVGEDVWFLNDSFEVMRRCLHVFEETMRVEEFEVVCNSEATAEEKAVKLGELMNQSHESLTSLFECSSDQLNNVTKLAREGGAFGSRLTGAGWGGCTVSLVKTAEVESFIKHMVESYLIPALRLKMEGQSDIVIPVPAKGIENATVEDFKNQAFAVFPGKGVELQKADGSVIPLC